MSSRSYVKDRNNSRTLNLDLEAKSRIVAKISSDVKDRWHKIARILAHELRIDDHWSRFWTPESWSRFSITIVSQGFWPESASSLLIVRFRISGSLVMIYDQRITDPWLWFRNSGSPTDLNINTSPVLIGSYNFSASRVY